MAEAMEVAVAALVATILAVAVSRAAPMGAESGMATLVRALRLQAGALKVVATPAAVVMSVATATLVGEG